MKDNTIRRQYRQIDIFRFVCSIMIVMIHSLSISRFKNQYIYFDIISVCAVAVPFFFACTGYFLFGRMIFENGRIKNCEENKTAFINFEKNIVLTYLMWSAFYIALNLINAFTEGREALIAYVKTIPLSFFVNGSFVHLWYVVCVIYAVPIMYFLFKKITLKYLPVIIAVLYIIGIAAENYSFIGNPFFKTLDAVSSFMGYGFHVFARAIPFLGIGMLLSRKDYKHPPALCLVCFIVFFFLGYVENRTIWLKYDAGVNPRYNTVLPLTMFFLFEFLLKSADDKSGKAKSSPAVRKIASIIYFIHPCLMLAVNRVLLFLGLLDAVPIGSITYFLIIAPVSAAVSFIIYIVTQKFKWCRKIIRY